MEGQLNMEGLIPIAIAVAWMTLPFPDFLFSYRQSRPRTVIRYSPISSKQQISGRKAQSLSIALLFCRSPSLFL